MSTTVLSAPDDVLSEVPEPPVEAGDGEGGGEASICGGGGEGGGGGGGEGEGGDGGGGGDGKGQGTCVDPAATYPGHVFLHPYGEQFVVIVPVQLPPTRPPEQL